VRLPRIDQSDLNVFEFDYDLTFMVFFLNADEQVYARYGGRDGQSADNRMSLAGLKHTMQSVLAAHCAGGPFAPKSSAKEQYLREGGARRGGCLHCHEVKEVLNRRLTAAGAWTRDAVWRYPLPDNLGFRLDVDRGNAVAEATPDSPAARVGLKPGDVVRRIDKVPVYSLADAQFALDKAPVQGTVAVTWTRDGRPTEGTLALPAGWRKSDLVWRASMRSLVPRLLLYGTDLKSEERKALGLTDRQLAFRQNARIPSRAKAAGLRAGDVVVALDGRTPDIGVDDFQDYLRREYLVGDTLTLTVLRDGQPHKISIVLVAQ
jgi:serine protease Do